MNNLSIVLYLADVAPSLKAASFVLIFFVSGAFAMHTIYLFEVDKPFTHTHKYLGVLALLLSIVILTPKQETILLIAASELGEEAVKSDFGQEVLIEGREALLRTLKSTYKQEGE